jgi:hypothetical protein
MADENWIAVWLAMPSTIKVGGKLAHTAFRHGATEGEAVAIATDALRAFAEAGNQWTGAELHAMVLTLTAATIEAR